MPTAATTPPPEGGFPIWLIPAALVGMAVLIGGVMFLRRRRAEDAWEEPVVYVAPKPEPEPLPPAMPEAPTPAAASAPRFLTPPPPSAPVVLPSSLTIEAPSVRRAGINLITATADVSVVLRNDGAEPLRNIRVEIRLTSAQPGQDAALAALFSGPIERLFTPAFDLVPGAEKTVRTLSTMARDAITVLQAGERPMFVPVVAVRAIESGPDGERQAMAAYALGVERAGSEKLGPFWLDQPPRMYDNIGVRPHAVRR
ncbi:hypothetical protein M0208_06925 [Sphingomonas sp. SUN019]|uniref:hypothetical protein n=1 Tax=Sphingomonas sp. SUN019 TaxID=2937788 RepID=UPI002164A47E|nr:hypothetical protein [Sphingomonas sp. SUN019]UVO50266.1 hypothetical protein M0208_06925 [Sphingomonas sp. SUN019]